VLQSNPLNDRPADTVIDHAGQALVYAVTLVNDGTVDMTGVTTHDSLSASTGRRTASD